MPLSSGWSFIAALAFLTLMKSELDMGFDWAATHEPTLLNSVALLLTLLNAVLYLAVSTYFLWRSLTK